MRLYCPQAFLSLDFQHIEEVVDSKWTFPGIDKSMVSKSGVSQAADCSCCAVVKVEQFNRACKDAEALRSAIKLNQAKQQDLHLQWDEEVCLLYSSQHP